jgi:hypothetical protein
MNIYTEVVINVHLIVFCFMSMQDEAGGMCTMQARTSRQGPTTTFSRTRWSQS